MRRTPTFDLLAASCVAACLSALVVPGFVADAVAQPPGPEIFIKEPQTPLELWDAVDYLVRTGQVAQAVPFLNKFLKTQPDDATLLAIRDRYGVGSVLRLDDYPETRAAARPLAERLNAAMQRNATRPERLDRFVAALTKTREEQEYAVERLREAGPYAVPVLVHALDRPGIGPDERGLLVRNIGRLDRSAVPPLLAALDSPDARIAADAADALGSIGDARAIPLLTAVAARDVTSPAREAARRAIAQLTGHSFESQPRSPVRVLTDAARGYHLHAVQFPGDSVIVWSWDELRKEPVPRQVSRSEAEAIFGIRLTREALRVDPSDVAAQVVLLSIALEKDVEKTGFASYLVNRPSEAFTAALGAGPDVLGRILRGAIDDRKLDLAAVAATALGQVTDREVLADGRRANPLVEALTAPGRRVQFAAARALVQLDPRHAFAGSSQVVPTLARFVINQAPPRAVVIDGNTIRGSRMAGFLNALGYQSTIAPTGDQGFRLAAESADVELILLDPHLVQGDWRLVDTLSNLRADARTAGIPIYIVAPNRYQVPLDATFAHFPGVRFMVTPTTVETMERQLGGRPSALSDAERAAFARDAAALLARVAARPGNPFESDLRRAESALTIALNTPPTSLAAASALGDVPDADAQQGLANVLLDPSKPPALRLSTALQLARSIQRFGPLVAAEQEERLVSTLDQERDPAVRTSLAMVVGALRPKPAPTGRRLQQYQVSPTTTTPTPAEGSPAPGSAPSPPNPETAPAAADAAEAPQPPAGATP